MRNGGTGEAVARARALVQLAAMILALLAAALQAAPAAQPVTPASVIAAARADEWVTIAPDDLLVMDLAPDAAGHARRVVIQLMPPPFSQGWVRNIRTLARARWWDGTSVNRVQDNYVAQWGDPNSDDKAKTKPLPGGLASMTEGEYSTPAGSVVEAQFGALLASLGHKPCSAPNFCKQAKVGFISEPPGMAQPRKTDSYAEFTLSRIGWPMAGDGKRLWPVHCYAAVGVGRDLSPDTGTGAELYAVIGTPPRHLDRNIALVGRVVEGIENLSSLPRGTGDLGFYKTAAERTPIRSVRLASELPEAERPHLQYLSTESASFARYVDSRANRHDAFFIQPAGGVDICNAPVPVRRVGAK